MKPMNSTKKCIRACGDKWAEQECLVVGHDRGPVGTQG